MASNAASAAPKCCPNVRNSQRGMITLIGTWRRSTPSRGRRGHRRAARGDSLGRHRAPTGYFADLGDDDDQGPCDDADRPLIDAELHRVEDPLERPERG